MLESDDLQALQEAVQRLENPSFAVELAHFIGMPVKRVLKVLPPKYSARTQQISQAAIQKALDIAVKSLGPMRQGKLVDRAHRAATAISGAVGGSLGIASTLIELPITTVVMLRSIAEIARMEGEDLALPTSRLACLEVFALGGRGESDDEAETGYFAVRAALAKAIADAASFIAQRGIADQSAPVVLRLVSQIAARFGVAVSEKAAAQAIPVVGAFGGAAVNLLFMDHFQKMAHGHFTVRRLERKYGPELIRAEYDRLRSAATAKAG
jgi:hypothetical protein